MSFLKRDKDEPIRDGGDSGWAVRLRQGLAATRSRLGVQLAAVFGGGRKVDEQLFEDLEAVLLSCDVGVEATRHLLEQSRARAQRDGMQDATQIREALRQALLELLAPLAQPLDLSRAKPFVILMAGVNGAGKTTSIG
ncbi:MAG TPA: signal recognition particle receptor subunit alpha, partial [Burkholderiales bacterium]|nr:signal recognition particle receptor subunit alpha [Burkholderiales bacterium]